MVQTLGVVTETRDVIDIRNLYYIFLYAWEYFDGIDPAIVRATKDTELVNLFAKLLLRQVSRLVRRRLNRRYLSLIEETTSPRGRFLIQESMRTGALQKHRLLCLVDDLKADSLENQIIKSRILRLLLCRHLDRALRNEYETLLSYFTEVKTIPISRGVFSRTALTRHTRHYRLTLKICELLHTHLLVGEGAQETTLTNLLRDEEAMDRVFEAFVRNFYRAEQSTFTVSRPQIPWAVSNPDDPDNRLLPTMQTDIVLTSPSEAIIIDTKFYRQILGGRFAKKVRSPHLYQLFTYMSQWSRQYTLPCSGILLYAKTEDEGVNCRFEVEAHSIHVISLDLGRSWEEIHDQLLQTISR